LKSSPWARRQARRALVQALYQWQMSGHSPSQIITDFEANGSLKKADRDFFHELLNGVVVAPAQPVDAGAEPPRIVGCAVDGLFVEFLDRGIHELDKVELAVLRLGCFELEQRIDVPFRVVIDEYVELTKLFGAEDAHKYVNGILDKVAGTTRQVEVQARTRAP